MPYIAENFRDEIGNQGLNSLADYVSSLIDNNAAGALNYIIFKIVRTRIEKKGRNYFFFAWLIGTLICGVFEIYRRLIAPYEDKKITENGDI